MIFDNVAFDAIVKDLRKDILEIWSEEDKTKFFLTEYNEDSLFMYHSSLGMYIRNKYHLWGRKWEPVIVNGVDHSQYHPDVISMTIIKEVWRLGLPTKEKI